MFVLLLIALMKCWCVRLCLSQGHFMPPIAPEMPRYWRSRDVLFNNDDDVYNSLDSPRLSLPHNRLANHDYEQERYFNRENGQRGPWFPFEIGESVRTSKPPTKLQQGNDDCEARLAKLSSILFREHPTLLRFNGKNVEEVNCTIKCDNPETNGGKQEAMRGNLKQNGIRWKAGRNKDDDDASVRSQMRKDNGVGKNGKAAKERGKETMGESHLFLDSERRLAAKPVELFDTKVPVPKQHDSHEIDESNLKRIYRNVAI